MKRNGYKYKVIKQRTIKFLPAAEPPPYWYYQLGA